MLCATLWGSAFPGIKSVYQLWEREGLHPTAADCWWFAGVRFTLAGLMLLAVARRPWAEFKATPKRALFGFAVTQTFGQYLLFYLAISAASASLSGLLSALGSFWWMLLAPLVAGVPWPRRAQWLAIAIGGVGVAVAAGAEKAGMGNPWLGTLLLIGSTGLGTLGLVQFGALQKTIGARAATGFSLFGGGLGLLLAGAPSFSKAALLMPPEAIGKTVWLAFVSAAAFAQWNHLSTRHPVPLLAGYRFLIPMMATIESMLFLGERPGWRFAAGGVLILGSLIASQRLSRPAALASPKPIMTPEAPPVSPSVPAGVRFIRQIPPTPLVPVTLDAALGPVWCKLEFMNPSGSTKDRIARHILEKAWRRGAIRAGDTVVEASSGSTSIALALACAQMGLKFVAFIPSSATNERGLMIRAYGGEVRRIEGGMLKVLEAAEAAAREHGWFAARQFENPDNAEAHRMFTGPEILAQMECGCVDAVVSGVGTGGTLRGLWEAFDDAGCGARAYAAIPCEGRAFGDNAECASLIFSKEVPGVAECLSLLYKEWREGPRGQGIEEVVVREELCLDLTQKLWALGYPVGPSSGLNYAAALEAKKRLGKDARVVTVFPDRMERYFSHRVFAELREEVPSDQ